ncbi:hypothetical protein FACS189496_4540 [Bacilli bacterium]|nr:hypothetical protein FACS189496_4540 [Bacilli bacterium]
MNDNETSNFSDKEIREKLKETIRFEEHMLHRSKIGLKASTAVEQQLTGKPNKTFKKAEPLIKEIFAQILMEKMRELKSDDDFDEWYSKRDIGPRILEKIRWIVYMKVAEFNRVPELEELELERISMYISTIELEPKFIEKLRKEAANV